MKIEEYVIENYISKIIICNEGKRSVNETDLQELDLSANEMIFIKKILKEQNITINEEKITKKDRTKLSSNFEYGKSAEIDNEKNDLPTYAELEYSEAGELISEDYEKLNKLIETTLIPENIVMKQKRDKKNREINYFPSIQLKDIIKNGLSDAEIQYTINYLQKSGIRVGGLNSTVDNGFENYDYGSTYKSMGKKKEVLDWEDMANLFYQLDSKKDKTEVKKIREELILSNMRLVSFLAYKYSVKSGFDIHELEQYGYEALIKAVDNFDLTRGVKFVTYAFPAIMHKMDKGVTELSGFYSGYNTTKNRIEKERNTTLLEETEEVADEIVLRSIKSGAIALKNAYALKERIMLSIPENLDDEAVSKQLIDDCPMDDKIIGKLIKEQLLKSLDVALSPKQKKVILKRFGFDENRIKSFEEITNELGLKNSEETITLEAKAIHRLKKHLGRSKSSQEELREMISTFAAYNYEPNKLKERRTDYSYISKSSYNKEIAEKVKKF